MRHTKKSIILFLALLLIVVFFTGLNLGKYIQRVDNEYVPPAPTPTLVAEQKPVPTVPPAAYDIYTDDVCGVAYVMPNTLTQRTTNAGETEFTNATQKVYVTCNDAAITAQESIFTAREATSEATLADQNVTVYSDPSTDIWIIRNAQRQRVLFETSQDLSPLIQQTLELE